MARNSSVSTREGASTLREETSTPQKETSDKDKPHRIDAGRIDADLKRRARLLITNGAIPSPTRSLIRYALEIRDPYLAEVVRRVEAGEMSIEWLLEE